MAFKGKFIAFVDLFVIEHLMTQMIALVQNK